MKNDIIKEKNNLWSLRHQAVWKLLIGHVKRGIPQTRRKYSKALESCLKMPFKTCYKCIQLCLETYNFHVRKGGSLQSSIGGRPCRIIEETEGKGNRRTVKASVNLPHSIKVKSCCCNMKTRFAYLCSGYFWCTAAWEGNKIMNP